MLITLAIIGVVAALTIPTLISSYKKNIVETRLKTFYSTINEAIRLSEIDNGDKSEWNMDTSENFYNEYLANYIKTSKVDVINKNNVGVYFLNGSAMKLYKNLERDEIFHIKFYVDGKITEDSVVGRETFFFLYLPEDGQNISGEKDYFCNSPLRGNSGVTPYFWYAGKTVKDPEKNCYTIIWPSESEVENILINQASYGCAKETGAYCTELIRRNNWKIPTDYPIKF